MPLRVRATTGAWTNATILVALVVVVPAHGADDVPDAKQACIAVTERGQRPRIVVLGAKDEHGTDVTDVTVTHDDQPFATTLDGKPLPIDTGPHVRNF
jgi:hypothetical protein